MAIIFTACTVIPFSPSWFIHWNVSRYPSKSALSYARGSPQLQWVPVAFPIDKWDLGRIINVETGEIRGRLFKEQI